MKELGIAIDELHQKAMHLADEAFYAKRAGDGLTAQKKYLAAYEFEKGAAMLLLNEYHQEPTRSVFFRSAASILLNLPSPALEHYREAERMVAFGLSGSPPEEIAEELREIWRELMVHWREMAA